MNELLTPERLLTLWYEALDQEIGLVIPVDPSEASWIQSKLHNARKEIGDPRLDALSAHLTPDATKIMIYKKDAELPDVNRR